MLLVAAFLLLLFGQSPKDVAVDPHAFLEEGLDQLQGLSILLRHGAPGDSKKGIIVDGPGGVLRPGLGGHRQAIVLLARRRCWSCRMRVLLVLVWILLRVLLWWFVRLNLNN